ncbi:DUF3757 domain-containing protein [Pseudomonas mosselii]|uniref:DUF3757 domain-containing protein n=1 Tax=Pseudomonas mosselii TaxID=78327 RepID=UPI000D87B9B4|nr:DUF3757 domain-containing protein [Pseudomonas mosselii]PYC17631.1 hypothetical protein DMX06_18240 [Pseudomonas mosselii]
MRMICTTLLALLMVGNAAAATCPSVSSISQKEDGQGYAYSAAGGWEGDNPVANEEDLSTFAFVGAKVTGSSVICRYEGENEGGTSLTLAATKQTAGDGWKNGECTASEVGACAFK